MDIKLDDFKSFFDQYLTKNELQELPVPAITIDYKDLEQWNPEIAREILDDIKNLNKMKEATQGYTSGKGIIEISIKNVPDVVELKDLGAEHIGKIISLHGTINRVIPVRPLLIKGAFQCKKCGEITHLEQDEPFMVVPYRCEIKIPKRRKLKDGTYESYSGTCGSRRFRRIEDQCIFTDVQELTLQERPKDMSAGQLPRQVELQISRDDLINGACAGDDVIVTGVLRTKPSSPTSQKREFLMFIEVNYIEALNKEITDMRSETSPEEEMEICNLAKNPVIYEIIINSIAPSIYGHRHIKEAIMYLLFGGVKKERSDISIRGEMNVLLVGDPSTAKSQLLQVTANISPRAVYTSGRGASGVGLTASVSLIDGNIPALNAGAAVIADKGVLCIDEADKMRIEDRESMHETMEMHTVSINKWGINARLNARIAVLAAANPDLGRYDRYKTLSENIKKLTAPFLSRFDLIFVIKDKLENDEDEALSAHILGLRDGETSVIDITMLKKYIAYAKTLKPELTIEAKQTLQDFYMEMRKMIGDDSPVSITPRQLQSLVRITEAHAKIALRNKADVDDALAAIKIVKKFLEDVGMNLESGKIDIDSIMTGIPKVNRDKMNIILSVLSDNSSHSLEEILETTDKAHISRSEAMSLITKLSSNGTIFSPLLNQYQRVF